MNKKQISRYCKTISMVCLLAIVLGSFSVVLSATEYVYDKPLESNMWEMPFFVVKEMVFRGKDYER